MAKAKNKTYKLNYYDETGRRRGKTFTAPTRRLARDLADDWASIHLHDKKPVISVSEALQRYLDVKQGVLSPSTIRSYEGMQKNHFDGLGDLDIHRLTNADVQAWVSGLALKGLSPKTVRNCYGFLSAALAMQDDDLHFKVQLPQKQPYQNYCPTEADIAKLITYIQRKGNDELLRAVLLSVFAPARRSEVCAICDTDIKGNTIYINKALVKDPNGTWVIKQPKTPDSTRKVTYPSFVINRCKGIEGRIIKHTPDYIGDMFRKTLKEIDVPYFRFHDLRHFGASIMMYMGGISQRTIENRGGWASNSATLKKVYQNTLADKERMENEKINAYFEQFNIL